MSSQFDRLENRLQAIIENTLNRLPWRNAQPRLAIPLMSELRDQLELDSQSDEPLPDRINIIMHPDNCDAWEDRSDWQEWLARVIADLSGELTRSFAREPEVRFVPEREMDHKKVRVVLTFQEIDISSTAVLPTDSDPGDPSPAGSQAGPFLILEGNRIFPLKPPVTNIGRRESNDLVLSDIRVSRDHAQIRIIHGECVLFDLNSTGGTFVNGQRITTYSLRPGDVIVMAGTSLIYGEDSQHNPRSTGTSPAHLTSQDGNTL